MVQYETRTADQNRICEKERKPKRELCERTNVQEMKKRKEWKMLYTFGYKINIVHNAPE
jgi:hypothetical protein